MLFVRLWVMTGKGDMLLSLFTKPVNQACSDNILSPSLSLKEKDTFNPSDPKFNADFSADENDVVCQLCVEKERLINALNQIIAGKDDVIKAKDETIRCQNELIESLSSKSHDDLVASAS